MITSPEKQLPEIVQKLNESQHEFFFFGAQEMAQRFQGNFLADGLVRWEYVCLDSSSVLDYLRAKGFYSKVIEGKVQWIQNNVFITPLTKKEFPRFKKFWETVTPSIWEEVLNNATKMFVVFSIYQSGIDTFTPPEPIYGDRDVIIPNLRRA